MISAQGKWMGGTAFEVVMDVVWDCYNNWGLRAGFNDAATHTIVPWYARSKPVEAGSATNPRWGMAAIQAADPVCVNGMWQTSANSAGPHARSKEAWAPGSLVRVLVETTLARCQSAKGQGGAVAVGETYPSATRQLTVGELVLRWGCKFFTDVEKIHYTQVYTQT